MTIKDLFIKEKEYTVEYKINNRIHLYIEGLSENGEHIYKPYGKDFNINDIKNVICEVIQDNDIIIKNIDITLDSELNEVLNNV